MDYTYGKYLRRTKNMSLLDFVQSVEQNVDNNDYRREEIEFFLEILDIPYQIQKYSTGKNIYATLGKPPFIGLGSHYDAVPKSPGANDNCSAVAVTIDILRRTKQNPLKNIGIRGFFFDEEEKDLKGSRAYVKEKGIGDLLGLYNMELVGSGDRIALWEVDERKSCLLVNTLELKARENGNETNRVPIILSNAADHISFKEGGLEDAFTLTTISSDDLDLIPKYMAAIKSGKNEDELWEILYNGSSFKHYHKESDKSEYLSQKTLQMVSDLLWDSINEIDRNYQFNK